MKMELPEIRPEDRTPLVEALLASIRELLDRVAVLEVTNQQLRDEIAKLKGQKPRPDICICWSSWDARRLLPIWWRKSKAAPLAGLRPRGRLTESFTGKPVMGRFRLVSLECPLSNDIS